MDRKIIGCPVCGQTQNYHRELGKFDEISYCKRCNTKFVVEINENKKVVDADWRIIYCPICTTANQFWVRQKNMPFRCQECKNKIRIKIE